MAEKMAVTSVKCTEVWSVLICVWTLCPGYRYR